MHIFELVLSAWRVDFKLFSRHSMLYAMQIENREFALRKGKGITNNYSTRCKSMQSIPYHAEEECRTEGEGPYSAYYA